MKKSVDFLKKRSILGWQKWWSESREFLWTFAPPYPQFPPLPISCISGYIYHNWCAHVNTLISFFMVISSLNFIFYWGIVIYNVVLITAIQKNDSYIYTHTHIRIPFLYSFPLWFIPGYWIDFLVLYSRTSLFIHWYINHSPEFTWQFTLLFWQFTVDVVHSVSLDKCLWHVSTIMVSYRAVLLP